MKKKAAQIIALLLCISMLIALSGCEYNQINEAKKCVDKIFEYSIGLADAQRKLETCTVSNLIGAYKVQIDAYQNLIDKYTQDFDEICEGLSEEGVKKVEEYIDKAASRKLSEILGD